MYFVIMMTKDIGLIRFRPYYYYLSLLAIIFDKKKSITMGNGQARA